MLRKSLTKVCKKGKGLDLNEPGLKEIYDFEKGRNKQAEKLKPTHIQDNILWKFTPKLRNARLVVQF